MEQGGVGELPGERVVIIEDEPDVASLLAYRFRGEGFGVATAGDGRTGLEAVRRQRPCLVILDLLLPELDGWGVFRALRADPTTREIPVIIFSAVGNPIERERFLAQGAADFIPKPSSMREVLARARTVLDRRQGLPAA